MKISMAVVLIAALVPLSAAAQSASPAPEPYRPGLGDLMTMTVQPRHIKLLLAGHDQNCPYAKYELHQLQEAFERSVKVWPRFRGLPLGSQLPIDLLHAVEMAVQDGSGENRDDSVSHFGTLFLSRA